NIAVDPARRRHGFGRTLLQGVIEDARRRGLRVVALEVRPSNSEARGLYESFGFQVVGRRRGYYYDTGEDALVMEATLSGMPEARRVSGGNQRRA
ncbi:MAG: GNAT family N-acetyltransferase, partial [Candidatus Rokuibacteriota bacterium]